jgi:hypothetical protein
MEDGLWMVMRISPSLFVSLCDCFSFMVFHPLLSPFILFFLQSTTLLSHFLAFLLFLQNAVFHVSDASGKKVTDEETIGLIEKV